MRLVSLLPSATEVVAALGLADDLVGVSHECDRPPGIRERATVVVGGLDTAGLTPGEVDAAVRARVAAGEDLYTLRAGALADLAPDLVLTQDLCQVCALPASTVRDALAHLGTGADVLTLDPHTLEDVLATVTAVGERAGVPERAAAVLAGLRARLDDVASAVAGRSRPRVAVVEWTDPPFTAGHWVPDLVTAAGGDPVGGAGGDRSVPTTWAAVEAGDPDVVLVAPCGCGLDAAVQQARDVVAALPGRTVWAIDADGLVVRPGPRLVEGVEAIASVLHPGAVPPSPAVARVSG